MRRSHSQRGSALLIVFVFAAVIAIMLYRELPIAVFEARRQKEELLVDRGNQYKRAIQLYYRKNGGRYPASIEVLENTNNVRFLRQRYKDPFTGKDDWRMLHAGPGGQLMDSKIRIANLGIPNSIGGSSGTSSSTAFGSNSFGSNSSNLNGSGSNTGFGSTGSSFESSSDSGSDVIVPNLTKRSAATGPGGRVAGAGDTPSSSELDQNPAMPLLNTEQPENGSVPREPALAPGVQAAGGQAGAATEATGAPADPNAPATATGAPGVSASTQATQNLLNNGAVAPQGQTAAGSANQNGMVPGSNGTGSFGTMGNVMGGSLAGVASKAKGLTIKKINDQVDYSLWEFWYDPRKDTSMGTGGSMQNGAGGQNLQNGTAPGNTFGFGGSAGTPVGANGANATTTPTTTPATSSPTTPDTSGSALPPSEP